MGTLSNPVNRLETPLIDSLSAPDVDLRISPGPVIAVLLGMCLLLFFVMDGQVDADYRLRLLQFTVAFYAMTALAWIVTTSSSSLGCWAVVVGLTVLILFGEERLRLPGFLVLLTIPIALAAVLIHLRAAVGVGVALSAAALALPRLVETGTAPVIALTAVWGVLAVIGAAYRPIHEAALANRQHSEYVSAVLSKTREGRGALAQALDDLAHANRQLALANERTARLREVAEEAQKAKTAFVARVSHEFRTPLNMIIGLVGLMTESPEVYGLNLPTELTKDLTIVQRNTEHLTSLVDDVLALSQAEADRLTLHRQQVDLGALIEGALAVVQPLVEKKRIEIAFAVPPDLPSVYCDRVRVRQVLLNLVSNAVRFTDRGGVRIQVVQRDRYVVISVSDTGAGIPPEQREGLFEPFSHGRGGPWREGAGSGLGLSISKQFVELHGGRIWFESEVGKGSTFSFDLPIELPDEHARKPGYQMLPEWSWIERSSLARPPDLDRQPLVVVCDETGELPQMHAGLSDEAEFVEVSNLNAVAEQLLRFPAHAVVVNSATPQGMWSALAKTRASAPDTPLLGWNVPPRGGRVRQAGAVSYLVKPVTRTALLDALGQVGRPVRRVLVVDDDPDVLQLFERVLLTIEAGLEITLASDGIQALDALREEPYDLVMLDVVMPGLDGWQVLNAKQQDARMRDVPVILVSAQDPINQPVTSPVFMATVDGGLSLRQLVRCSLAVSSQLLRPD